MVSTLRHWVTVTVLFAFVNLFDLQLVMYYVIIGHNIILFIVITCVVASKNKYVGAWRVEAVRELRTYPRVNYCINQYGCRPMRWLFVPADWRYEARLGGSSSVRKTR